MTNTTPTPARVIPSGGRWILWWASVGLVTCASFFERRTGACGTAHYLYFRLWAGVVTEMITGLGWRHHFRAIEDGAAVAINVGVFVVLTLVLRRKASGSWFTVGLVGITALYLASYFLLFPTRDCP